MTINITAILYDIAYFQNYFQKVVRDKINEFPIALKYAKKMDNLQGLCG